MTSIFFERWWKHLILEVQQESAMEAILDAIIQAAEKTAAQATGNDKDDWDNFAKALRVERQQLPSPGGPQASHPIADPPSAMPKT